MAVGEGSEAALQPAVPRVEHNEPNTQGHQQHEQDWDHDGSYVCGFVGF